MAVVEQRWLLWLPLVDGMQVVALPITGMLTTLPLRSFTYMFNFFPYLSIGYSLAFTITVL